MMHRRGFTLMEVLIAIALLLVLSSVIFTFLRDVMASRERIAEITAQQRLASLIIDRIEEQAIFSIVGDAAFGSGISGDETSLIILSRGVAVREVAHADSWHKAFFDLIRTEYQFDEGSHSVRVSQEIPDAAGSDRDNGQTSSRFNIHRINPEEAHETFSTRLYKLRFRYHDGIAWSSNYDSLSEGRLPRAIEVAIWFDPWPGSEWNAGAQDPFADLDDVTPDRLTFDMEDVFDELEYAMRADRDFRYDPPPDRIRVIAIPDADDDSFDIALNDEAVR
jgi:prepilin-type N-terminal cleavage/methylation domain-containing protein